MNVRDDALKCVPEAALRFVHHCDQCEAAWGLTGAWLQHTGAWRTKAFLNVGNLLDARDVLRDEPLSIKPVMDVMMERVPGDMGDFMRMVHAMAGDNEEPVLKFAETIAGNMDHMIEEINRVPLKDLYTAVIVDLWKTVGECRLASLHYASCGEDDEPLTTAIMPVYALSADPMRGNDGTYWRDKLIMALGTRTVMLEQIAEKLSEFAGRLRRQREAMKAILSMVHDIGQAVDNAAAPPPSNIPPKLN